MKFSAKALLISAITALSSVGAIVYSSSCNTDKCKTIVCANRGICNKGACICPEGYVGTNCETENRKRFTGNWSVFEKGTTSLAKQYQVSVEEGGEGITYVGITNFYNFFQGTVKAYVDGDKMIIPTQHLEGKVIFGYGDLYSNVTYGQFGGMTVRYLVQDETTLVKDDFGYEAAIDFSDPSNWNK